MVPQKQLSGRSVESRRPPRSIGQIRLIGRGGRPAQRLPGRTYLVSRLSFNRQINTRLKTATDHYKIEPKGKKP